VNENVEDYIDLIAERAIQLGGIANSTSHVVATWRHMPENDTHSASSKKLKGVIPTKSPTDFQ
jgi:DNA-binding ferritin-like protein